MIRVRPMKPADVDAAATITAASPEAANWGRQTYEAFLSNPAQGCCQVAEQEGVVVGLVCFRVVAEEAELLNVAVLPTSRGRGIGSCLVEQVLQEAAKAGAKRIFLEVRGSNRPALDLYERFGFALCGRRAGYYTAPPADALILHRPLPYRGKDSC